METNLTSDTIESKVPQIGDSTFSGVQVSTLESEVHLIQSGASTEHSRVPLEASCRDFKSRLM